MLLRAEEAAAELCELVEDEVRRVVEATLHRSLYVQRAAARTQYNAMCPSPTRMCVLLLCIYIPIYVS